MWTNFSKGDDESSLSADCEECKRDLEMAEIRMAACTNCVKNCEGRPMCRQQCTSNRDRHLLSLDDATTIKYGPPQPLPAV